MQKKSAVTGLAGLAFLLGCGGILGGDEEPAPEVPTPETEQAPADAPPPGEVTIAGVELVAQGCSGIDITGEGGSDLLRSVVVLPGKLIVAGPEGKLHGYDIGGGKDCVLTVDKGFGTDGVLSLEHEINWLSKTDSGLVLASSGIFDTYGVRDGKLVWTSDVSGYVEASPDGTWGVAPWVNATVKRVDITDTGLTAADWVLKDLSDDDTRQGIFSNVNTSAILGDDVLIGGIIAASVDENEPRVIVRYDRAGAELARAGNAESSSGDDAFGWVHAISRCEQGFCAVDSNYHRLSFWKTDGTHLGSADLDDLFAIDGSWYADLDVGPDGYGYFLVASSEGDQYAGHIYRLSGMGPHVKSTQKTTHKTAPKKHGDIRRPARAGRVKGGKIKGGKRGK